VDRYLLFQGRDAAATISQTRPLLPSRHSLPVVVTEVEDGDILNFLTGGQNGVQAYVSGKVKIVGDLQLGLQLQEVRAKKKWKETDSDGHWGGYVCHSSFWFD
jgi:hypothetical protein